MAILYVKEYKNLPQINTTTGPFASEPGVDQAPITFAPVASSAAFALGTKYVRVVSDTDCFIVFGNAPIAASNQNAYLPAKTIEYYGVVAGQVVSVHT